MIASIMRSESGSTRAAAGRHYGDCRERDSVMLFGDVRASLVNRKVKERTSDSSPLREGPGLCVFGIPVAEKRYHNQVFRKISWADMWMEWLDDTVYKIAIDAALSLSDWICEASRRHLFLTGLWLAHALLFSASMHHGITAQSRHIRERRE